MRRLPYPAGTVARAGAGGGAASIAAMRSRRPASLLCLLPLGALLAGCSGAVPQLSPTAAASASPRPASPPATASPGPGSPGIAPVAGHAPVGDQPWYLAVGDSVTSGFTLDPSRAAVNSAWAAQLQPLLAASGRNWSLYDTACPSERTATYSTLCPGRAAVPFLASTSQHDAAMSAIAAHRPGLRAVFVDLGSNDLLDGLRRGATAAQMSASLTAALTRIVDELRAAAPRVPVILGNFYDPLANLQPATRTELDQVNAAIAAVARATGAHLADFHSAIDTSTAVPDPALCTYVDCAHGDIHPTVAGHARLAAAALAALDAA
jgi:lysophospholipase L1-like esterase